MVTLNIGSGRDQWGEVRLDLPRSQTGVSNKPNLIGSALSLPIKSGSIDEIRCSHVIEHLKEWRTLLREIARVSGEEVRVQLRFPIDDGYKLDFLISWSRLDLGGMRHAYVTRRNRAHYWIVNPILISRQLEEFGMTVRTRRNKRWLFSPSWLLFPRWRKFFPSEGAYRGITRLISTLNECMPRADYEWVLDARR